MFRRIVLFMVVGLGIALAGLYLFRAAAVEALIVNELATRGVAVGGLSVTRVGLDELHIADLSLGTNGELRARALQLFYEPAALLRGEIETVAVAGLILRLDLTGTAPPLGSLQALLAANSDGGAPGPLPVVEFSDARIEAATPIGPITATLDGEAWSEDAGEIAGAFSFNLESAQGRLIGAFDLTRTASGAMTGNMVVEDGLLRLPGAEAAGLLGEARYALVPGRLPELDGWISAASIALPDTELPSVSLKEARIALRIAEKSAEVTVDLRGNDDDWSLALTGTLDNNLETPSVRFDLIGFTEAGTPLWPLLALPIPAAGTARVRAEGSGRLAPLSELAGDGTSLTDWLGRAALESQIAVTLSGLAYPGRAETVAGRLRIAASLEDGALAFRTLVPLRLVLAGMAPDWLRDLGLPEPAVPLVARGVSLFVEADGTGDLGGLTAPISVTLKTPGGAELTATSDLRLEIGPELAIERINLDQLRVAARRLPLPGFRLREFRAVGALAGTPPNLSGELELRLDAADIAVRALRAGTAQAVLPVALEVTPGTMSLQLTEPGRISLDDVHYGGTVRLAALAAAVQAGAISHANGVLDHRATLTFAPNQARIGSEMVVELTPGPLRIQGSWRPDSPYRGTLLLEPSVATLPAQNLVAEGIEAKFSLGPAPTALSGQVTLGALSHRAEAPVFAPLSGSLTLRGDGESLTFEGEIGAGATRLAMTGHHIIELGRGAASLALDPLAFAPGGLQPGALAPPLAELHAVTGGLNAQAELAWNAEGLTGGAEIAVENLSFDSDSVTVQDLDFALTLTSLTPPASAPGQRLTIGVLDPGVPLEDVALRFQIHPGDPLRLGVEEGQVRVSGGRVLLRDVLLDPAAPRLDLPLDIEGLDLAEMLRILDIDGLSGSGRLSGRIPIAIATGGEGDSVTISNGRLAAEAPGTLRFESEGARQALAAAGESADLMLHALQDFRYDELSLAINKPAAAGARLTLTLLGHNPDVLEGYPFRFNINLEGDTDRLVAALSQAYTLSNRMLRRFRRAGDK